MSIIDGHCDVLMKLYENKDIDFYDSSNSQLDVTYAGMLKSRIKVQCFAIYLSEAITQPHFEHYLEYINIFYQKIVKKDKVSIIRNRSDLIFVMEGTKPGAILTLEGADAINNNPLYTQTLFHLGVRMIGVTWNHANWAADGVREPRQGAFSVKGKRFIKECNDLGIILDASHLSEKSFWDMADCSAKPFVATHSNAKALCSHPRNLDDNQIRALILREGRIGVTFVPWFVSDGGTASITQLIKHIEHICALGGEKHVVFGSDFDGIESWIPGLENSGQWDNLTQQLSRYYSDELISNICSGNWYTFLKSNLPV